MQVNQPSNLLDRIKRAEQQLQRLWKAVGLASATISRGGLTLLQDAFLRMVDDNDTEILYFGPDTDGHQVMRIRREDGSQIMFTGQAAGGRDFWALSDSTGRIVASDDAASGVGLARPWLSVPMYPLFTIQGGDVVAYMSLPVSELTGATIWEGRASISHPYITVDGQWGEASGDNTTTYRLLINGNQVGSWTPEFSTATFGPFDVAPYIGLDWCSVRITATASGTGAVAVQLLGCYLHQTL
ncbi:hypothetical protein MOQ72_29185 [Saccharopolyspora sp. K220]|uniref:hypothetical protein n=1 Tax=Saccharopolyspora soli TaxID=2926618 RepID=UPI001F5629B6|nr:hypothetical protein [Saccharopolyspora soli]MCI2421516.1 hypothetical protein [Saccharopolyspora soli]